MIFGFVSTANLPLLSTLAVSVERVSSFKLLGQPWCQSLMVCSHHYHCRQSQQTTTFSEADQESGGSCPTTSAFLRHSNSTCSRILRPSLALCHHSITGWTVGVNIHIMLFTSFILSLGACHILIYCSSLNLPPLNRGVTNFQGHSFKISLIHLFPLSFILPPRDTSVLSRLRTVARFPRPVSRTKNIAPLLITP